jgi:Ca2+-binding RTX toxin-like protein
MVTTPNFTDGTWQIVSTIHVDGDPNGDILWQNIADQSMVLWQQDGATTTSITDLPSLDDFQAVVVGDFDGDGKGDQFLRKAATGADKILLSSTGTIGNTATVADTNWSFRAAADFSGDGKDDIFSYYNTSGLLQTWEMNGTIVSDTKFIASGYTSGDLLHSVFNGTAFHTFDSLWFDVSANQYDIPSYDSGVRTVTDNFTVQAGQEFVNTGDYDGDGNADFFFRDGIGTNAGSIEVVYTNGNGETHRLGYQTETFNNAVRFQAGGDFDGDGISEVLGTDSGGEALVMNTFGGTIGNQTITGSGGADLIAGNDGNDRIFAGDGDDMVLGQDDDDTIFGGDGNDMLDGGLDDDSLFGGNGDDILQGDAGDDVLTGGAGNDRLYAGNGTDFLNGDDGDDILWGGPTSTGFDHMKGGTGNDVLMAGEAAVLLEGDSGDDQVFGGDNDDYLFGGSGNDFLVGGFNNDTLWGGSGNDILVGSDLAGSSGVSDTLNGGSGTDFFYLGNDDTAYYTIGGNAEIQDFTTSDYLVLNGFLGDYTITQAASDVEIRLGGALIADVLNSTTADVTDNMLFIA